ncbi:helix-turn-helix transcriptional regulator [Pseudomonas taiwanensis]|uniref:LuxR C-terminal-related transcriptional regulator n=1 Tax=Pseudomonas taiwanensis TaxID=470150 RepID=UPI0015BF397D|nr:LuxR C-terminal-related transcriptional regulator [Pseudomonas taiwanensis]NWL81147.1 helix-turn-helix transcriptional regulator [Pseudomonas taiwanensis]
MPNRPDLITRLSLVPTGTKLSESVKEMEAARLDIRAEKFVPQGTSSGLLTRDALLQRMERNDDTRLILVRAAAGFGKTTLLRQYRERCIESGRHVIWINLDRADNDPRRLAAHLQTAFEALDNQPGDQQELGDSQALLRQVGGFKRPFAILLDDFESLDSPQALAFIQQLLSALPSHGRLAIASRINPELGLGRMRIQGQVLEIDTDALRFSREETVAFIRGRCELSLGDADIARLQESTEGWVTGLFLATLSLRGRSTGEVVGAFSGSSQELAEYLAEDILASQSDEVRLFLLQTSILDRFSAPLCDSITGRQDSRQLIEQLLRANLFIQPTDEQHQWFRYHRLFSGFLRGALARQLPGQAEALHRAAAHWFLAQLRPESAIEHLLCAGAIHEAVVQLEKHLDDLVDAGRLRLLLRWFEQIPVESLDDRPRLILAHAWLLALDHRYRDAMQVVERTPSSRESETIRCLLLSFTDQVDATIMAAQAQLEHVSPDDMLQYGIVATPLAFSLITTGRYDEAQEVLNRITQQAPQERSALVDGIAVYIDCSLELTLGHRTSALARLRASSASQPPGLKGKWVGGKATLNVLHALMLYEEDALTEAWNIVSEIPQNVLDLGGPDALIAHRVLLARISLHNGNREAWLRHLADLEQLGRRSGSMRILCSAWLERARVATLEGRLDIAAQAMTSVALSGKWERPEHLTFACDSDTPFIARQRLAIARGEHQRAAAELRSAIEVADSRQQRRRALKLRLLHAMALAGLGRQKQALDTLTPALRLASHEGFLRTFLEEGPMLVKLLERWAVAFQALCSSLDIKPEFLADLLQRIGAQGAASEHNEPGDPEQQLTTRELQVIRLLAAGNRNRAIADQMHLSEHTVKTHLRNISAKLGAQGRTEAIAIARARGLLD